MRKKSFFSIPFLHLLLTAACVLALCLAGCGGSAASSGTASDSAVSSTGNGSSTSSAGTGSTDSSSSGTASDTTAAGTDESGSAANSEASAEDAAKAAADAASSDAAEAASQADAHILANTAVTAADTSASDSDASAGDSGAADSGAASDPVSDWVSSLPGAGSYDQLVVVESSGTNASVSMYTLSGSAWTEIMHTDAGHVGAEGVGTRQTDYDKITPAGTFPLYFAFGQQPDPGCAIGYYQFGDNDYWAENSHMPDDFNTLVTLAPGEDPVARWGDGLYERLADWPLQYAYSLLIGYNIAPDYRVDGGGGIFLHVSSGNPTAGCVSVPEDDMIFILQHIDYHCGIVIQ